MIFRSITRSVVGKLWITIIAIVAVLFLLLSTIVFKYFDNHYYTQQSNSLSALGEEISLIIEKNPNREKAIEIIDDILRAYETNMVIIKKDATGKYPQIEKLFSPEDIKLILENQKNVVRISDVSYKYYLTFDKVDDFLAIAYPLSENGKDIGVIILYQSLERLYEVTNNLKKILLLFVGIASVITTFFSFFLSYKITAPIRQMKKAAVQMARGNFKHKISIRTTDEIGELADSFNKMASQLAETVQALSDEKEKLTNILKSMADGVITVNRRGDIIVTNPPADKLLLWEKELPDSIKEMLETVIKQEVNVKKDINLHGRILSVVMAPLFSDKVVNGAVMLLRDVTYERKLNKLRQDFLANVSHELRTPISMIQGYSEAIIDDMVLSPEETKELTHIIYEESLRMGRLVNDLLDLARMESGMYQIQYSKTDIKLLIDKMIRKFSSLAQEHKIELISDYDPKLPEVYVDGDRIEQVLTNLVDNAIRHTKNGGKITIRAKLKSSDNFLLEVSDTGEGIPEQDIPYVFERFYKADKARTRGNSGTGLGLSIVKNIVNSHGGTISVDSKIGQGTTFSIIIPTNI
ncbi:ATP-binding protein [Vulcanibacillus modesticaldus]|uniref:ATP-binding protein n=1 Tax=Vulcanibacillus modesticaldus TaxID=337097 RepID=UPI0009FD23E4|nr:ATP-binding protein [Vulcanibacillus modesticaldus]